MQGFSTSEDMGHVYISSSPSPPGSPSLTSFPPTKRPCLPSPAPVSPDPCPQPAPPPAPVSSAAAAAGPSRSASTGTGRATDAGVAASVETNADADGKSTTSPQPPPPPAHLQLLGLPADLLLRLAASDLPLHDLHALREAAAGAAPAPIARVLRDAYRARARATQCVFALMSMRDYYANFGARYAPPRFPACPAARRRVADTLGVHARPEDAAEVFQIGRGPPARRGPLLHTTPRTPAPSAAARLRDVLLPPPRSGRRDAPGGSDPHNGAAASVAADPARAPRSATVAGVTAEPVHTPGAHAGAGPSSAAPAGTGPLSAAAAAVPTGREGGANAARANSNGSGGGGRQHRAAAAAPRESEGPTAMTNAMTARMAEVGAAALASASMIAGGIGEEAVTEHRRNLKNIAEFLQSDEARTGMLSALGPMLCSLLQIASSVDNVDLLRQRRRAARVARRAVPAAAEPEPELESEPEHEVQEEEVQADSVKEARPDTGTSAAPRGSSSSPSKKRMKQKQKKKKKKKKRKRGGSGPSSSSSSSSSSSGGGGGGGGASSSSWAPPPSAVGARTLSLKLSYLTDEAAVALSANVRVLRRLRVHFDPEGWAGAGQVLDDLPAALAQCAALEELSVTGAALARFPAVLWGMPQLRAAALDQLPARAVPAACDVAARLPGLLVLVVGHTCYARAAAGCGAQERGPVHNALAAAFGDAPGVGDDHYAHALGGDADIEPLVAGQAGVEQVIEAQAQEQDEAQAQAERETKVLRQSAVLWVERLHRGVRAAGLAEQGQGLNDEQDFEYPLRPAGLVSPQLSFVRLP